MFRDEYRKANDSIHAPNHLLDAIKSEIDASSVPNRKQRMNWSNILVYSGCTVAIAALALLILRPFSSLNSAQHAPVIMEAKASDEKYGQEEQMTVFSAGMTDDIPMLAGSAAGSVPEPSEESASVLSDRADRNDGDEDEYYIYNTPLEETYDSIFSMLIPQDVLEKSEQKNTMTEFASSDVYITGNTLSAFGQVFELPEVGSVRALIEAWDNIYVISEEPGFVVTSVYNESGALGSTKQSGTFVSYEIKETTVFEDDYSLSDHHIVMVASRFSPDLRNADVQNPSSFVPVFSDNSSERPLTPEEITCVNESSSYTVYGAVEATDSVKMLYIFAELG